MTSRQNSSENLMERIQRRRECIDLYVKEHEKRSSRLTMISIVCGSLASVFTAGPAIGGKGFTENITQALGTSPQGAPAWRLLCAAATLFSVAATVATTIFKTQELAERLTRAQAANTKLEGLEILLDLKKIDLTEATQQYTQYIQEVPFIPCSQEGS